jgi:beta-xylosidase
MFNRRFLGMLLSWWCCMAVTLGRSPSFQTFMNPVIPGDHPDCTLTRVGKDFYTTGSSFNVTPVIFHSTDLVHWEAIAQPVSAAWSGYGDEPGGGCWGGHMVFYNGNYWHFFSRANVMYYVKAPNPKGPWGTPVKINVPTTLPYSLGYDNSVFIDDDNKWYLVVKNGKPNNGIVELDSNGQPTGVVYDLKWLNPDPIYPYSWAEGPVMWKYAGFYYYSFARDLGGGQKVMRSRILTAEQTAWEMLGDFFGPSGTSRFTTPNHISPVVLLDDSTSWVLHPLYAQGEWKGQGRQGLLNQVHYDANGKPVADYPNNESFLAPNLPSSGIPWMVPKSDFFDSPNLHPEWSFLGYTATSTWSLTERPGWLRLSPKNRAKANTILKNDGEHNYTLITRLIFEPQSPNDEAGLWIIRGDEQMAVKLVSSHTGSNQIIAFSFDTARVEVVHGLGDTLWLKLVRINHKISAYYSAKGQVWTQIATVFDISVIDAYADFSTFTGTRQGLYVRGSSDAWFDLYIYRDAYTPILAECPANQFGTSQSRRIDGICALDNIHPNDWALYAGVEFGGNDYRKTADSVQFVASCASLGGIIEVWLDSLDTGTKIAESPIGNTGSWSTYNTFTTALIAPTSGNHDVYLKFIGNGTSKLFMLKWFNFTSRPASNNGSTKLNQGELPLQFELAPICPNPFNPTTKISYQLPTTSQVSLQITDVCGRTVATILNELQPAGSYNLAFNACELASGIYFCVLKTTEAMRIRKMLLLK